MKILISCLSKSWGGMEMVVLTSIKELLKKNISIELLCIKESRIHIEANTLGIVINHLKSFGYIHPFATIKLAGFVRKGEYDLIHTHASKDLWLIVPALKLLHSKIPLIMTKHVGSFIIKKDALHKFLYKRVTYVLAISKIIKKNLLDTCPLTESQILLHYNGVDLNKFDLAKANRKKIRDEFEIKDDEILIGMLARFSIGKGHEEFLFAAKELSKKFTNLKFMVVGEASRGENEYAQSIKNIAEVYRLKKIIFTGYRSDTADILSAIDIFVFPSHSEAFGIALVEAMAMGKPSVCSDSDGILDIAVDGETSYLFKNKDAEDLTNKISLLINSPQIRKKFSLSARKRVEEKFEIEKTTDNLINIYKKSLEEKT